LVFIQNDSSGSSIYKIYSNIISNEISSAWEGGEFLRSEKDGFSLVGDKGQGCKFEYTVFIRQRNKSFYLDNIKMSFYCPGKKLVEKTYNYNDKIISLDEYNRNIVDFLKEVNKF
jgi:hypothetical protein